MAAPTEHQVCLILFAKNTGLKTTAGYDHCNAATAVRTSSRSARSERVISAKIYLIQLFEERSASRIVLYWAEAGPLGPPLSLVRNKQS